MSDYKYKGMGYLKRKLASKQTRISIRYDHYEMKNCTFDFGISTPPQLKSWISTLGWCAKAVDSLADRLQFKEFRDDNFNMNEIFQMNNPDVLFDSAILESLISACSFIYISKDVNGYPRLQVIDGYNATGIIDSFTGMLKEGYAVISRDTNGNVLQEAYFIPGRTYFYTKGNPNVQIFDNKAPYPLLVPIVYRPDSIRPFGHSRISRACMSIVGSAARTIKRSEISAEFYSFPQKYATGISEDAEMDKYQAAMSYLITLTKDEDGDTPTFGQFQQQSMSPHTDQLRMFASLFAGETGLTLDDLGFATENPSSAEAIKASHENLRLTARKAQRTYGSNFINVGYLAACVRDNYAYERNLVYKTKAIWNPLFEPDMSALSLIGDGVIKLNQGLPGFIDEENLSDLTGIEK